MAISDKLQELLDIKQDIKEAIENKDVDLTGVTFDGYAGKIDEIETGGGGTTGGYRVTFDLEYNGYSNVTIQQTNGNNFIMSTPSDYGNHTIIFENVTYIKWNGSGIDYYFEGITKSELNAGKTLTNDVVLSSNAGGAN